MSRRGSTWSVVLVVGVLVGLVSGCTGSADPEPTPQPSQSRTPAAASPTPSPSASPAPTPSQAPDASAEDPSVPPDPPAALGGPNGEEGALAVAEYYMKLLAYIFVTGDLTEWSALGGPDCFECNSASEIVTEDVSAGRHQIGGGVTVHE